jgi:hypothetical protein
MIPVVVVILAISLYVVSEGQLTTDGINISVMYPGHYPKMVLNICNRLFKSVRVFWRH